MHVFHSSILREYDIRGEVGKTLSQEDAYFLGRCFGTLIRDRKGKSVALGYDGRLSSPSLAQGVSQGLCDEGISVKEIGLGPTPMLSYAIHALETDGGIMVTGSHNPPHHNGFKITIGTEPFFGEQIQNLKEIMKTLSQKPAVSTGTHESVEIKEQYVTRLTEGLPLQKPLTVVWDPGNGASGEIIEMLTKNLPGNHILLNTKIDGTFPVHHPDPTVPENLIQLQQTVQLHQADLGIAFDGDGDRIGVVDGIGRILFGDQLLILYAQKLLQEIPKATIIADVKASQTLFDEIAKLGGAPIMGKTGHSLIKAKMKETKAPLAGEMSGHIFFADRYYGFDDAVYTGARLLEILSKQTQTSEEIFAALPNAISTPELKLPISEAKKFSFMDDFAKTAEFNDAKIITIDGLRVEFKDGWGLIRPSNTTPYLILRFEADNEDALTRIQNIFREQLLKANASLEIPF